MTCTGFSGAEIVGFLGEPTPKLVMKPEKPDFFLKTEAILGSFVSSEKRFDCDNWASAALEPCDFSAAAIMSAAAEKLADCRWDRPARRASGVVWAFREKVGRVGEEGDLMASMRLRMAEPSKGAPMNSSDAREWSRRWVL